MAVNDARVRETLNGVFVYMEKTNPRLPKGPEFFHQAWLALKEHRADIRIVADEDFAAAEHYLFARQAVGSGEVSASQMTAQVIGYTTIKKSARILDALVGFDFYEPMLRHQRDVPTSKPSKGQLQWGLLGVSDGERDRRVHSPGKKPPLFNPEFAKY
jgi:hypothetical protein